MRRALQSLFENEKSAKRILLDGAVQQRFEMGMIRLDITRAAILYLRMNMSTASWNMFAAAVNRGMSAREKHGNRRGIVPCYNTVRLEYASPPTDPHCPLPYPPAKHNLQAETSGLHYKAGCRLERWGVWLLPDQLGIELLNRTLRCQPSLSGGTSDNPVDIVGMHNVDSLLDSGPNTDCLAVYIKDVMNTQVAPELMLVQMNIPSVWNQIIASKTVHILLAADNHSRTLFNGRSSKLEVCSIKLLLPHGDISQQAAHLAIPIFMHEGVLCLS